jgi:hypothetical protein
MALMCVVVALSYLGNRVYPDSLRGNCWSYALWRWDKYGGYLAIRKAYGVKFLGWFPVPHVIWVKNLPRKVVRLKQFVPVDRKTAQWIPYFTGYFKGKVISFDVIPNADNIDVEMKDNRNATEN